jgi:hypothetical protein
MVNGDSYGKAEADNQNHRLEAEVMFSCAKHYECGHRQTPEPNELFGLRKHATAPSILNGNA